jgi:DNA replication protein DnaD
MIYEQTTQVPNFIFSVLPDLTEAELKIILVVIRQTLGWEDKRTGQRKTRDRITISQFMQKSGLSKRAVTKAIQSLSQKHLLTVTDFKGNTLTQSTERKGKSYIYYSLLKPMHQTTQTSAQSIPEPVHETSHNKTNYPKETVSKAKRKMFGHIGGLLPSLHNLFLRSK